MSTLFQIHASISDLKSTTKQMAQLWQAGDSILLLDETATYLDWLDAYITDINYDDENEYKITDINAIYVLNDDIAKLCDSAKLNIDFSKVTLLSDKDWVNLTQKMERVVTLSLAG